MTVTLRQGPHSDISDPLYRYMVCSDEKGVRFNDFIFSVRNYGWILFTVNIFTS